MRKVSIAFALALAALSPAAAQTRQTMSVYGPVADCTVTACTAASAQFCQETGGAVLRCDAAAGFYVPTPGFSSADCSLESCNAAGVYGQTCADAVGLWRCNAATGAFVLVSGGALAGSAWDVQLKGTTGSHASSTLPGALQWDDVQGELDVAALDVANTSDFGGNITLSTGGATVDGKDISGQGAFKNESNAFLEDQTLASGKCLGLEGAAGDTEMCRDVDLDEMQVTVDGTIATRTSDHGWEPPPCPADLNDVGLGRFCKDTSRPGVYVGGVGYLTGVAQ